MIMVIILSSLVRLALQTRQAHRLRLHLWAAVNIFEFINELLLSTEHLLRYIKQFASIKFGYNIEQLLFFISGSLRFCFLFWFLSYLIFLDIYLSLLGC